MVQLNLKPEIEVFCMLFDRFHFIFTMPSLKKEYFNFRCRIHLDHTNGCTWSAARQRHKWRANAGNSWRLRFSWAAACVPPISCSAPYSFYRSMMYSLKQWGRFIMGKWNSPNLSETQGFEYPGHSNWTISSLLSQFCSLDFPPSTSLYWGVQFLLPQREEGWKWGNGILPTWVRHRGLSAWGIQTGPFAAC